MENSSGHSPESPIVTPATVDWNLVQIHGYANAIRIQAGLEPIAPASNADKPSYTTEQPEMTAQDVAEKAATLLAQHRTTEGVSHQELYGAPSTVTPWDAENGTPVQTGDDAGEID